MCEDHPNQIAPNRPPGIENLPDNLTVLNAQAFLENIPSLVNQLRMRFPNVAWSLNLSQSSLDLLSRLLNEGVAPIAGDHIVKGINRSLVVEVSAYLGSTVVRNLNGKWHKPTDVGSEPYVTYRCGDQRKSAYPFSDVVEMALQGEFDLAHWYRLLFD